ncbi:PAS domain S-box protein [Methanolobus mangrovi]|uniref:histidine kinase n=1 Tax=Methanolobus mangrovi TaxID=3072977 RepID=A0AA51UE46_9EURY|nr:PAS domain S-box protein [Methanolobus mangrovi]WMW21537.1 PAS domain S-box protein [Methanolobus mangrovi]
MVHSEDDNRLSDLRKKIIGLGETSHRKSYYPQLKGQINELNLAMRALQESEKKYRTLVENVNIGIVRSEPWEGGHIIQVNPAFCKMLGFNDEKELLDISAADLYLYPEDRLELLGELRQTGKIKDRKIVFKVRDGTTILCSITLSTEYDPNGNMILMDGVVEDITEKERRSEALKQANNKLSLLNSITRHDIINQVMLLEGYLYLVMEQIKDPEELRLLQRMEANVMSIERHIMFATDYQEIGIQAPQWVNLLDALTSAMVPVDKALINIRIDVGDYLIFSDPMIGKVFYNLVNNVIKHSEATNLTITTEEEENQLLVVFQDDGIGIMDKSKLFKKGGSSSGYGLFLSKEILSITGIGIRETGMSGKGARFELVFSQGQFKTPV